jgi:hypothetical protein
MAHFNLIPAFYCLFLTFKTFYPYFNDGTFLKAVQLLGKEGAKVSRDEGWSSSYAKVIIALPPDDGAMKGHPPLPMAER